jgi:hypothetical protein
MDRMESNGYNIEREGRRYVVWSEKLMPGVTALHDSLAEVVAEYIGTPEEYAVGPVDLESAVFSLEQDSRYSTHAFKVLSVVCGN